MKLLPWGLCALLSGVGIANGSAESLKLPIVHQKYYQGERELYGYNPDYIPGVVSFDPDNRPFLRHGAEVYTLNSDNKWNKIDLTVPIRAQYPQQPCDVFSYPAADERIVFDRTGNAYTHVLIDRNTKNIKSLLLFSSDRCRSWQVLELPIPNAQVKLEVAEPGSGFDVPAVVLAAEPRLFLLPLSRDNAGKLSWTKPVEISSHSYMLVLHSGAGNAAITRNGKVYIVYAESVPYKKQEGTPLYIAVYDLKMKKLADSVFIGSNGHGKPDNHNVPTISIDPNGYLHCLLGSHHDPFVYLKSLRPEDPTAWQTPIRFGEPKRKLCEGSYTYPGFCRDPFGNYHLVSRWAGDGYKNYLVYQQKKADGPWTTHRKLVEPFKTCYSVWYHKLTSDRIGRLFLFYYYYGNELTAPMADHYQTKWSNEKLKRPEHLDQYPNGQWLNANYHDPVILISNDGGENWRFATSFDFTAGVMRKMDPGTAMVNSVGMKLVKIPAGRFVMGSLNGGCDEKPVRPVQITHDYYLGQMPVTVGQFRRFVTATGYKTVLERTPAATWHAWLGNGRKDEFGFNWQNPPYPQSDNYPVTLITRVDAQAFCDWLSKTEKQNYRLPSEAEWEYACRAGSLGAYCFGDDSTSLPLYGWYHKNSGGTPHPVGKLKVNALGLYDMHGNVWELCRDYYALPLDNPQVDPISAAVSDSGPVIKGGGWIDDPHGDGNGFNLRSASRYHIVYPRVKTDWVGFRVLKEIKE